METSSSGKGPWWSVPQAIAWIITLNEWVVDGVSATDSIEQLPFLPINQSTNKLPISKTEAPNELLKAWRAGRLEIWNREEGAPSPIPRPPASARAGFAMIDKKGLSLWTKWDGPPGHTIEELIDQGGARLAEYLSRPAPVDATAHEVVVWSRPWIPADDCKKVWPAPPMELGAPLEPVEARPLVPVMPPISPRENAGVMPVDVSVITTWARPIIDRIVVDGRQLKRWQFDEMVRDKFNTADLLDKTIRSAWAEVVPTGWRAHRRVPDRKAIADWRSYVLAPLPT